MFEMTGASFWKVVPAAALLAAWFAIAPASVSVAQSSDGGGCHPNYRDACVPDARDVDCAGGNGDGPAYVEGPVRVVGRDVYRLDRDGNGYGCEPEGWEPPKN